MWLLEEEYERRSLLVDDVVGEVDEKYMKSCGDCRRMKKAVDTDMSAHHSSGRYFVSSTLGKNKQVSRDASPLEGVVPFNQ